MTVIGIDLAGPANVANTAVAEFEVNGQELHFVPRPKIGADQDILDLIMRFDAEAVVGLDAPLSYQPGGGRRQRDLNLAAALGDVAWKPAVIAPTAPRMAYLTLRGMAVARAIRLVAPNAQVVETHPKAAMALRGGPQLPMAAFQEDQAPAEALLWLEAQGLYGVPVVGHAGRHRLDACVAALAAWSWHAGNPVWLEPADWPLHPYDFAC